MPVDLSAAQEFDTKYTQLARALSRYYGEAMVFASHLSAPIARDNLGRFPSLYVGFGAGVSFGNVIALRKEVDSSIHENVPSYLAAPNMSFNFGMGFTRLWDLRFSFFPNAPLSLNTANLGGNTSAEIRFGTYRARLGYHIWEGGTLKPGLTLAGFASYTTGKLRVERSNLDVSANNVSLTNTIARFNTEWHYLGIGPELRAWYDLMFFHPFIGYSLGLQMGYYATGLYLGGDITVNNNPYGTGYIEILERQAARLMSHRLLFGFEVSLFFFEVGAEAQVDLTTGLVGVAFATAFRF
ncbi:MAG: hypothetical protein N2Z22_05990 [Turneriella sp.]|nr:hypothetical protein [Turneriella sp.]